MSETSILSIGAPGLDVAKLVADLQRFAVSRHFHLGAFAAVSGKFWGQTPKLSLRRGGGYGRVVEMKGEEL